jgi:hypothetical protein
MTRRRDSAAVISRFVLLRLQRWRQTLNKWDVTDPTLPVCPITSDAICKSDRIKLVDASNNLTYYDAAALYRWFCTTCDFRCPLTRRLLLINEVGRCARAAAAGRGQGSTSYMKESLATYAMSLYTNRARHLRASHVASGESASRLLVMESHINQAFALVRASAHRAECDTQFVLWRQAYHHLREVDAMAANTAVFAAVDFFLLSHAHNQRQHTSEYGHDGNRLVAYHLTIALNMVMGNSGVPPPHTLRRLVRFNTSIAYPSAAIARRRTSIMPYHLERYASVSPSAPVASNGAVIDLTEPRTPVRGEWQRIMLRFSEPTRSV